VDFPLSHREPLRPFPWRTATVVVGAVAVVELLLLIVVGGALLAKPDGSPVTKRTGPVAAKTTAAGKTKPATKKARTAAATRPRTAPTAAVSELPRRKVEVLVLNGNGRTGAAATAAARVRGRGYRIGAVANAPRRDYPESIVLYRRGFEGEGQRLARDLGVKVVGPLDGMRAGQLHGAHVVMILGA
jgi:LytR cell envelope-related transcriptional attenuator